MHIRRKLVGPISLWLFWVRLAAAQDLAPRAYIITPVHANAITLTWSFYDGGINLSGSIPITGATGTYSVPTVSLYHAFSFFGRSANVTASLPYGVGTFSGNVLGTNKSVYRSRLLFTRHGSSGIAASTGALYLGSTVGGRTELRWLVERGNEAEP